MKKGLFDTTTRDIYRNGVYLGNVILSDWAYMSEEEYEDFINKTFELKQNKND